MNSDRPQAERRAAEIIQTWLDGAPPDAAGAIAENAAFAAEKAIVLDLAFAEFLIREHKGEVVDAEAFCARFPDHYASLGRMLTQQSVGELPTDRDVQLEDLGAKTITTPVTMVSNGEAPPASGSPTMASPTNARKASPGSWPEAGGKVGDFNLLRQLGKGAYGRVFLALEEPTSRHVVVKVSRQKCDEAKVLGRVGHRNVVSVLSAPHDHDSGFYLVVMPYLGSATLEDLLEIAYPLRRTPLALPRRASVIGDAAQRNRQASDPKSDDFHLDPFLAKASFVDGVVWLGVRMAEALHAVHRSGYVHHDLKPSNVLLGLDGQPRVLDFNLASDVRSVKSRLGGTLPYMPPEHLKAVRDPSSPSQLDARGDVYSLGVILYELLTGSHPFGRFPKTRSVQSVAKEMLAKQQLGVRPLRERNLDVPHRLARVVERCLSFDANERPATAGDLANELRTCYSAKRRLQQFVGTRPGRAGVTVAVVGIVSAATWMASANARPMERDHRAIGIAAVAEERYGDAVPELLHATQRQPDDAEAWLALGRSRIAIGEVRTAKADLERAANLRPGHGPTLATLAWCQAEQGYYTEAFASLDAAEKAGYTQVNVTALRAHMYLTLRQDEAAATSVESALSREPNHRGALITRAQLAFVQAQGKRQPPPPSAIADLERSLKAGDLDCFQLAWAARFYAWAAMKPPAIEGEWFANPAAAKERSRELLRLAIALGLPEDFWQGDSTYKVLLGDDFAKDWPKPAREAEYTNYWRSGNPLVAFVN